MVAKHVVARVDEIQPGTRKAVVVNGRPIVIFNIKGEFFALLNKCPHQGAPLDRGILTGFVSGEKPGCLNISRNGEIVLCPNHGWEFDIRTGQSWFDPKNTRVKTYVSEVASGSELVKGPYKAEIFPVDIEEDYVLVTL